MNHRSVVIAQIGWVLLLFASCMKASASEPPITAAAFTHDEKFVVVGSQAGIQVLSWPSLKVESRLGTELSQVNDLKFAPKAERLVAAGGTPGEVGEIEVWESPFGKRILHSKLHEDLVYKVDWSPAGQFFCTASADGTCKIVDATNAKVQAIFSGHSQPVLSTQYLNANQIGSMGVDNTIRIWDSETASSLGVLDNHTRSVNDAAVRNAKAQNGNKLELVSVGEDRTVRLWQPAIGRLVKFAKVDSMPRSVIWSNNGKFIYVGCDCGNIQIINAETMQVQDRQQAAVGRISEILLESSGHHLLACGELGCRAVELLDANRD